jgi:hypothetical protein
VKNSWWVVVLFLDQIAAKFPEEFICSKLLLALDQNSEQTDLIQNDFPRP